MAVVWRDGVVKTFFLTKPLRGSRHKYFFINNAAFSGYYDFSLDIL